MAVTREVERVGERTASRSQHGQVKQQQRDAEARDGQDGRQGIPANRSGACLEEDGWQANQRAQHRACRVLM